MAMNATESQEMVCKPRGRYPGLVTQLVPAPYILCLRVNTISEYLNNGFCGELPGRNCASEWEINLSILPPS